ncbi:FAD-dependent monooxygenase [Nonomuraea sp. NPDC049152]|uniref:FAD-dependent monooxygenase n=1 Tax=Nonomuraea sp. NPDC049152 TaxID=3154350 RepID=UPI0033D75B28
MNSSHALIVGGGIGGLATAIGMRRTGWRVTLLERAPAFQSLGSGITLAPNAVRALDAPGLGAQLRARGMAQGAAGLRVPSGRWLMRAKVETHVLDNLRIAVDAGEGIHVVGRELTQAEPRE